MGDNSINLKNIADNSGDLGAEVFHFAVDTCEKFKKYTGSTTCKSDEYVLPLVETFVLATKISYQFFSPVTYEENKQEVDNLFI